MKETEVRGRGGGGVGGRPGRQIEQEVMESGRETKRQTEKTTGGQHERVHGLEWNVILRKAETREEWRKLVPNLQWCFNGQPDYGIGEEVMKTGSNM